MLKVMRVTLLLSIFAFPSVAGFASHAAKLLTTIHRHSTALDFSKRPENEFSRLVEPDRILKIKRDYLTDIVATPEECQALADRFDLPNIAALKASLSMRREMAGSGGIEVEGTVIGTVTRICVRTNEAFVMENLEMPLYSIVRPITPISTLVAKQRELEEQFGGFEDEKKSRKKNYRPQDRNVDEMDIMELQRLLQTDISSEDDVLMEDEAIYTTDGMLDVGELVAQLFWLSLDPYPKKPGSDPVSASISG